MKQEQISLLRNLINNIQFLPSQFPPPSPEYYSFSAPKASDPVPLTAPSLPPALPSALPINQTFPLPVPVSSINVLLICPITTNLNKYLSYASPNKISSSIQTFSTLPPVPDQELSSVSENLHIFLR